MRKSLLLMFFIIGIQNIQAQDFYVGIGGTFVTSEFDVTSVNTELSKFGINNIDDIRYNNWGLTAQVRFKVSKKIKQ